MFDKLPKDIIIKIISYVEDELKEKILQINMATKTVHKAFGFCSVEYFKCHDHSCDDFCFAYKLHCEDDIRFITSHNIEERIHIGQGLGLNKHLHLSTSEYTKLNKCGIICVKCDKWVCPKHYKDYIKLVDEDVHYTCNQKLRIKSKPKIKNKYKCPLPLTQFILADKKYYKWPKENLIIKIPTIEKDYVSKYLEIKNVLGLLCKLAGDRLQYYKCEHYKPCSKYCYIFDENIDDPHSGQILITTSNGSRNVLGDVSIDLESDEDEEDYNPDFENYGKMCNKCQKWICPQHWEDNFDDKRKDRKHLFCDNSK